MSSNIMTLKERNVKRTCTDMLEKALYRIKQAPRAWYDRLSKFLIEHGNKRGKTKIPCS